jgi:hypothetical protein
MQGCPLGPRQRASRACARVQSQITGVPSTCRPAWTLAATSSAIESAGALRRREHLSISPNWIPICRFGWAVRRIEGLRRDSQCGESGWESHELSRCGKAGAQHIVENSIRNGAISPTYGPCGTHATMLRNAKSLGVQRGSVRFFYCAPKRTWLPSLQRHGPGQKVESPWGCQPKGLPGFKPEGQSCTPGFKEVRRSPDVNRGKSQNEGSSEETPR